MEELLALALFAGVGFWLYRHGKREGSRKAYRVGQFHSQRRQRRKSRA